MKMKIKAYKKRFDSSVMLVGEKLPHGIKMADPCYPAICVSKGGNGYAEEVLSVSDDFWNDAVEVPNFDMGYAIEVLGGRQKVEEILNKIAARVLEVKGVSGEAHKDKK